MTRQHCKCCDCQHEWDDYPGAYALVRRITGRREDTDGRKGWATEACCPSCGGSYWKVRE